jgi:hypothetical protein
MISGRIAVTVEATIRASGVSPSCSALSADMTSTAAAPSLRGQALPAVTLPSGLNTGLSLASTSIVVPGRGPSSCLTTVSWTSTGLPSRSVSVCAGTVTDTISASKWPESRASTARFWEMTAHSSCCSRVTPQRSATFSAVIPIGM